MHVSAYCSIDMCPHTARYVSAYSGMCRYTAMCVLILVHMRVGVCMGMGMGEEGWRQWCGMVYLRMPLKARLPRCLRVCM